MQVLENTSEENILTEKFCLLTPPPACVEGESNGDIEGGGMGKNGESGADKTTERSVVF